MDYITPEDHSRRVIPYHPSQRQHHVTPISNPLYVVTAIQNPNRFYVRYKLYEAFEKHMADSNAILYTIELALRDRHHEVTSHDNPRHIQLRTPAQLWHKENLLNIAIQHLPEDWKYVAWIDADILFSRPDWVNETLHQLQHYHVVQMWSHAFDLGPNFEPVKNGALQSFMHAYRTGIPKPKLVGTKSSRPRHDDCYGSGYGPGGYHVGAHLWHPGYAWAARRSAISDLGGLGDIAILGSGDHHMATALVGRVFDSIHVKMHPNYKRYWERWQERAEEHIKRNVGFVPGTILHYWHGSKKLRRYISRWKVLIQNKYNPDEDIKRDPQQLWELSGNKPKLRDDIRDYFASRNEDSIDV